MAKRVGITQLHHLVGEKPQGPVVVPCRGGCTGCRNHLRTLFVGQFRRAPRSWRAKPISKGGKPLQHGPVGIIPNGHFFMSAPHPDSLDSRYALVGWVAETELVGRAISLY